MNQSQNIFNRTASRISRRFSDVTTAVSNEMLARKTMNSTLAHLALGTVAVSSLPQVELQSAWPALAFLLLSLVARLVTAKLYLNKRFQEELSFRRLYGLTTVLCASSWSAYLILVLLQHGEIDHITVLPVILLGGVAVAGTTALSPDKHLGRLFVTALLFPPSVVLLSPWSPHGFSLGLTLLTSLAFLLTQVEMQAKTLQAFRDREEKYRALTAATQEMVLIHEDGLILEVNNAVEQILGWTPAEMAGTNILEHTPIEDRAQNREILARIHNRTLTVRCVRKDGLVFHAEIYSRFFEYRGRRAKITCVRSVEDRLMAEKAMVESSHQIEVVAKEREQTAIETARMKSEFLANMSHEIRTPLNAIIGITDLMADLVTTAQQKRYLRTLGDSSESLLSLVNDILDFSKIDADKMEFEKIDFSVGNLIESQSDLLSARAQQKGLVIVTGIDPNLPLTLRGDSGRIGQVLLNLIGNAIKFTDNGFVNVRTVLLHKTGGIATIRFEIQDTGSGLSDEAKTRLFRPFSQADSSTSRKHGGTGLGLSICKKIVEKMGGEIGVDSIEGTGSTFWFTLPLSIVESDTISSRFTRKDWLSRHVFVVSDENSSARTIAGYLQAWGLEATVGSYDWIQRSVQSAGETAGAKPLAEAIIMSASYRRKNPLNSTIPVIQILNEGAMATEGADNALSVAVPVRQSDLYNALQTLFGSSPIESKSAVKTKDADGAKDTSASIRINARVLVAEDNSTNQMLVLAQLRKLGITAQAVTNGAEAVDALIRTKFDLVLMDCQMPVVDGFEATQKIRELEKTTGLHIPIIALTANAFEEDRKRCLEVGMDAYLSKPLRREQLVVLLKQYLVPAA